MPLAGLVIGGADRIRGGTGDDQIHAGFGDDLANGDSGGDEVFGDDGGDVLWGGKGCDPASAEEPCSGTDLSERGLNDRFVWDGRNGGGHVVSSGGYIVMVEAQGTGETMHVMRRKIAVVR